MAPDGAGGKEVALAVRHLSKSFGGAVALRDAELCVRQGEIHGLVGRNGSGKSTLIKVLSGFHQPDSGAELTLAGQRVALPVDPANMRRHGLSFVHQDLALAPGCSVLENIRIGSYGRHAFARIARASERRLVDRALDRVGLRLSADTMVASLRPVERALVAIARAIGETEHHPGSGVLVLDEATTSLPRDEVEMLFAALRQIARSGTGVLFVSHRVEEVTRLTDRVTVLRDGERVATAETAALSADDLIQMILGRPLTELYPERADHEGDRVLEVDGLTGGIVTEVGFALRRGEVVGMTGIAGMGHDEVPYLLFGARPAAAGRLTMANHPPVAVAELDPAAAIRLGFALLPADRQWASGLGDFSIRENLGLPVIRRFFRTGLLRHGEERSAVARLLHRFGVAPPAPELALGALSGGNQQKALLAKWLQQRPRVLMLHEPTQGVDVGAKRDVFDHIEAAAAVGGAVLISSAEFEDLTHICHRVLVFRDGRIVAELKGANLTEEHIVDQCYRHAPDR